MTTTETYFDKAVNMWGYMVADTLEFGRLAIVSIKQEGKTIRDFSIALCGNSSLEDRIGRYIMAAEFVDSLNSVQYESVQDWLTPTHFTELAKIEAVTDHDNALDLMQDLITEQPDGTIDVKPVAWLRAQRITEPETAEVWHKVFMVVSRALTVAWSEVERKGNLATANDRRKVRILKLAVKYFQSEPDGEKAGRL